MLYIDSPIFDSLSMAFDMVSSTQIVEPTMPPPQFWDRIQDYKSVEFAFWTSVLLLAVTSILKYTVSNDDGSREWGLLIVEIPVDLCLIMVTILVTIYLSQHVGAGILLILLTMFAIVVCCCTRRKSIKYSATPDHKFRSFVYGCLTVLFALALLIVIYNCII